MSSQKLITLLPNALMCLFNSLDQIKKCVKHVRLKTPYLRQLKKTWKKEAYVSKTHKIKLRLGKNIYNLDHRPASSRPQPDPPSSPQPGTSSSSQTGFSSAVRPKDIIPLPKTKVVKKETKRNCCCADLKPI
ncbi:hypothetical protein JTB14_012470 [Gonioctena quinquepunctata]|nr:hypothetical protein JTB14_012470 [Gonioctena quinquepunctata]